MINWREYFGVLLFKLPFFIFIAWLTAYINCVDIIGYIKTIGIGIFLFMLVAIFILGCIMI